MGNCKQRVLAEMVNKSFPPTPLRFFVLPSLPFSQHKDVTLVIAKGPYTCVLFLSEGSEKRTQSDH